jgi:gas vesicle protein
VNDHAEFSNSRIVASFVAGGLTGAAVALLFAPHSGRGTRSLINRTVQDRLDRGHEVEERLQSKGREGASNYLGKQRNDLEQRRRDRMEADRQLKDEAGL